MFSLSLFRSPRTKSLISGTLCSLLFPEAVLAYTKVRSGSACTANTFVTFVWTETASGNSEEHYLCTSSLFPEAVLSYTKVRSRSAVKSIICVDPCCTRGSLVPYKSKEHHFCRALQYGKNSACVMVSPKSNHSNNREVKFHLTILRVCGDQG